MPHKAACLGLLLLGACQPAQQPAAPAEPADPAPRAWYLAGALAGGTAPPLDRPGFEGAMDLLGPECRQAASMTGGKPPPCRVERWLPVVTSGEAPPPSEGTLIVAGLHSLLDLEGQELRRELSWRGLGPTLTACLDQAPMDLPPAGDPDGLRLLIRDARGLAWSLSFSGSNPCDLEGNLRLDAEGPGVDASGLHVRGLAWGNGGRQAASAALSSWLRLLARERWTSLDEAERILVIQGLGRDTDPEARRLLEAIAASGSTVAGAARAVLDHHPSPPLEAP